MDKVKSALHLKDAQLFLDASIKTREPVTVTALKKDGTRITLDGWLCRFFMRNSLKRFFADWKDNSAPEHVEAVHDTVIYLRQTINII